MTTQNITLGSTPRFAGIAERQRRGLTLDLVFAALIALVMVLSVIGFRSSGTPSSSLDWASAVPSAPSVAPGCVADRTAGTDLTC